MTNTKTTNKHILNRSRAAVITVLLLLGFLVYRLADLQLIHPDENRNNAILQYTNEVTINAKRGTIYDRTMQKLAVSTTVQTVFISPSDIKDDAQAERDPRRGKRLYPRARRKEKQPLSDYQKECRGRGGSCRPPLYRGK